MDSREINIEEINSALEYDSKVYRGTFNDLKFIKIYKRMIKNPEQFEDLKLIMDYIYSCTSEGFGDYQYVITKFYSLNAAYHALSLNLTLDDFKSPFLDMHFRSSQEIDNCLNFKNLFTQECNKKNHLKDIISYANSGMCDIILTFPDFDGNIKFVNNKIDNIVKDLNLYTIEFDEEMKANKVSDMKNV